MKDYEIRVAPDGVHLKYSDPPKVEKVIYNDPATVVIWDDGTKTVVTCAHGDVYDKQTGFLLCCAKKLFGNGGKYNDVMREHCRHMSIAEAVATFFDRKRRWTR